MKNILKQLSFPLCLILIIWFQQLGFAKNAFADIQTGNSGSGAVVINCVNTNIIGGTPTTPCPVTQSNPTQPPSEGTNPTPTPSGGGNNNNGGGGNTLSNPTTCTDQKPNGVPLGLTAIAGPGQGQATLSWGPPQGPFTTFSITYSDTLDTQKWGVPDTGNVTSYTISGLGVNQYYFWVRAVNGCTQGDPAGPVKVGGTGGPQVLGAGISPTKTPVKEVLGEGTGKNLTGGATCGNCIWWPIIAGEILALLIYFRLVARKKSLTKLLPRKYLWAVIFPVITYLIFLFLNRGCLGHASLWYYVNSTSFFCKWFWLIDTLIFILISVFVKRYWDKTPGKNKM